MIGNRWSWGVGVAFIVVGSILISVVVYVAMSKLGMVYAYLWT